MLSFFSVIILMLSFFLWSILCYHFLFRYHFLYMLSFFSIFIFMLQFFVIISYSRKRDTIGIKIVYFSPFSAQGKSKKKDEWLKLLQNNVPLCIFTKITTITHMEKYFVRCTEHRYVNTSIKVQVQRYNSITITDYRSFCINFVFSHPPPPPSHTSSVGGML